MNNILEQPNQPNNMMNKGRNKKVIIEKFGPELMFVFKNGLKGMAIVFLTFLFGIFVALGKIKVPIIAISLLIAALFVIPASVAW